MYAACPTPELVSATLSAADKGKTAEIKAMPSRHWENSWENVLRVGGRDRTACWGTAKPLADYKEGKIVSVDSNLKGNIELDNNQTFHNPSIYPMPWPHKEHELWRAMKERTLAAICSLFCVHHPFGSSSLTALPFLVTFQFFVQRTAGASATSSSKVIWRVPSFQNA